MHKNGSHVFVRVLEWTRVIIVVLSLVHTGNTAISIRKDKRQNIETQ